MQFEGCTEFAKYWPSEEGTPPPTPELEAEDSSDAEDSATPEDPTPGDGV